IYGGKPSTGGALCLPWGWEDVWTCDGTEYVLGKGSGTQRQEGYLEFRAAMRAVDPTILVGAVGYEVPGDPNNPDWWNYNNWGLKVISATQGNLDFYSIHPYPFFQPPSNTPAGHAAILAKPQEHFQTIRMNLENAFDSFANGRRAPIAITEYNLVSVQDQDNAQLMTRAINALFLADSIGQAIQQNYAIFAQWDLANGRAYNGTEYGLMHEDNNFYRSPQYYVYPLWARFGNEMLAVTTTLDAASEAAVYAGRIDADTLSLMIINKTEKLINAQVSAPGYAILEGRAYQVQATSATAQSVTYNGIDNPSPELNEPPITLSAIGGTLNVTLPPWSITLLHLDIETAAGDGISINRYLPSNQVITTGDQVVFRVNFPQAVVGVDQNDFALSLLSIPGANAVISNIATVSESTYDVTVDLSPLRNTAEKRNGAIRLDIPASATITNPFGTPLNGLPYEAGDIYSIVQEQTFTDVSSSNLFWTYIERLYYNGISGGYPDGTYRPENPVTRAEMAVFLIKAMNGPAYTPLNASPSFWDTGSHWAKNWIEALKAAGITSGYPDGTYRPENPVTRAQMAVFLLKAVNGYSYTPPNVSPSFQDTSGHWAEDWIEALKAAGITSGYPDGTYRPDNPVTRAEMAVFLVKAFNLP
ncbi:MAG: S-layer homology domain-containing protein, partial [Anaerolineales bacterium]